MHIAQLCMCIIWTQRVLLWAVVMNHNAAHFYELYDLDADSRAFRQGHLSYLRGEGEGVDED